MEINNGCFWVAECYNFWSRREVQNCLKLIELVYKKERQSETATQLSSYILHSPMPCVCNIVHYLDDIDRT